MSISIQTRRQHYRRPDRAVPAGMLAMLLLAMGGAHASDLIDLRTFTPPPTEARKIPAPTVRWWFRDNPESFCRNVADKDGFATAKGGCVFWQTARSTCTIVTPHSTTHSVLGHLLLRCMKTEAES